MNASTELDIEIDGLPMDVVDLSDPGLVVDVLPCSSSHRQAT
jgi:hypothetical protein